MSVARAPDIGILKRLLLDALWGAPPHDLPDQSPGGTAGIVGASAADADRRQRDWCRAFAGVPERLAARVASSLDGRHLGLVAAFASSSCSLLRCKRGPGEDTTIAAAAVLNHAVPSEIPSIL
jgi:hypothetical protein